MPSETARQYENSIISHFTTVEPLYCGHFKTQKFWPLLVEYNGGALRG